MIGSFRMMPRYSAVRKLGMGVTRGIRRRSSHPSAHGTLSLYYASDLHGSDRCWRKFLNAGSFYSADALVLGGDLAGKAIVPIERSADDTYTAHFLGEARIARSREDLELLTDAIRFNGMYPWIGTAGEIRERVLDANSSDGLFESVIEEELGRWIAMADERIDSDHVAAFVMAGNDDPLSIDPVLRDATSLHFCDGLVLRVGEHEMVSCSYSNRTPWNSPRELDETELYEKLKALADQLERPQSAIFNLHVPPYNSGLDLANEVSDELKVKSAGGVPLEVPVGSTAVREVIEEYQPLLALHGHIHESRAAAKLGDTLCLNPGSDYASGRVHGVLVKLAPTRVVSHQFVIG